jgi:MFS family permease
VTAAPSRRGTEGRGAEHPVSPGSMWRFVPITVFMPVLAATVGVDGGPIFQIMAVENLGLSATALGIAFGFGVVSVPVQLAAARIPLRRARRNVQIFLGLSAVQAWILAGLVAADATGPLATVALGVTVSAELAVSILFATAWQPLLSFSVDAVDRQRLNSAWQAIARGVLAGSLLAFGALSDQWRPAFLVVVGAAAVALAIGLRRVPSPHQRVEADIVTESASPGTESSPPLVGVFVVLGIANLGAMPLWLVYLDEVLWQGGNLGLVAAVQVIAAMAALLAWRPTEQDVTGRALAGGIITLAGVCLTLFVEGPDPGRVAQTVILATTALTAVGVTTTRIAMLEQAHRAVNSTTAVRAFTMLDVVASTSLQIGLVLAGFLVTAAASTSLWVADPYQVLITAAAASTVIATRRLRARQP